METIALSKDQIVFNSENYKVFTGGIYLPTDLVDVYDITDPSTVICSFQANYVAYGITYDENNDEEIIPSLLIYNYLKSNDDRILHTDQIDYDIIGLHKKRYLVKGELIKVEYYGEYNPTTKQHSILVVSEDRVYYRVNQMLDRREMVIKWYDVNGNIASTKNTVKYYSTTESMQELDTRRANIISDLKINTVGLVMMCSGVTSVEAQTIARPMVSTYNLEISKYLQGYEQELRTAVANDAIYSWLNLTIPNTGGMTIRQYLISGLTIDYSINNINM